MYTQEQLEQLNEILTASPLTISKMNLYNSKESTARCIFKEAFVEDNKLMVKYEETSGHTITISKYRLKEVLSKLGGNIKCRNKNLLNMKKFIEKSDKKFGPALREFLDQGFFITDDSKPIKDEIDWLDRHVRRILARVPHKLIRAFERQFPGQEYMEATDDTWSYGFVLYFDDTSDMPDSLLFMRNKDGNDAVDIKSKSMANTSYIARLVKQYPDKFHFGKRF